MIVGTSSRDRTANGCPPTRASLTACVSFPKKLK